MEKMIRSEARRHRFTVEKVGNEWKVTNPATGLSQSVPDRVNGDNLLNARSKVRQLATRAPMQAAVTADPPEQERQPGDNWEIQELVAAAYRSGVTFDIDQDRLRINADMDNRSWVDVLRRREDEVMRFLLGAVARHGQHPTPGPEGGADPIPETETPQGADESMPKIGDVARIDVGARKEDLAKDAKALYDLLREAAAEQGDEQGTNARVDGVLWTGTLTSVLRLAGHGWDVAYQEEVSRFLRDTGRIRCQKRGNPSIWWIREAWAGGTITAASRPAAAPVPPPVPPPADEYAQLMKLLEAGRTAAATIEGLEREVTGLRGRVAELQQHLAEAESAVDDVNRTNDSLHRRMLALESEKQRLEGELAKLEPFKQFIKAVKETDL
ncbi:hypothetical protein [Nonomuraea maritima]|uniref:hypothetical protein n=1 Tax=Nonomuraea maritima TaxID=683260 RepID=UPI00371A658A